MPEGRQSGAPEMGGDPMVVLATVEGVAVKAAKTNERSDLLERRLAAVRRALDMLEELADVAAAAATSWTPRLSS